MAEKIATYGWAIQGVEGSPTNAQWAYTIGLVEHYGHPELVITSVAFETAAWILHELVAGVSDGQPLQAGARVVVANVRLEVVAVHPRQFDHGVFNSWFDQYRAFRDCGMELSALQVLLPAEAFCEFHGHHQPRLDRPEQVLEYPDRNRAYRRAQLRREGRGRRRR
ncbi:MAG: DUF4262 domain-containing protein [Acidimicrobiales bacterium]